jgi:hypothetical protein
LYLFLLAGYPSHLTYLPLAERDVWVLALGLVWGGIYGRIEGDTLRRSVAIRLELGRAGTTKTGDTQDMMARGSVGTVTGTNDDEDDDNERWR